MIKCNVHKDKELQFRCETCVKYLCSGCLPSHRKQNHEILTESEISIFIRERILLTVQKLQQQLLQISTKATKSQNYIKGLEIIKACKQQILQYLNNIFENLLTSYQRVAQAQWKLRNKKSVTYLEEKIMFLQNWQKLIQQQPHKAIIFDIQEMIQIEEQQAVPDLDYNIPKIDFNETALRRVSESISQCIGFTEQKKYSSPVRSIKNFSPKKKIISKLFKQPKTLVKFVQGTNILLQYEIGKEEFIKTVFRDFIVPMRAQSTSADGQVYLIGGHNKNQIPSKEIWIFQRKYTMMRIVAMMKKGRIGHSICSDENNIYIFGGKQNELLERFNLKNKNLENISSYSRGLVGCSSVIIKDKIFIFGGGYEAQPNNNVIIFDLYYNQWKQCEPLNRESYSASIYPIVCPITETKIVIFGGCIQWKQGGQGNLNSQVYNIDKNIMMSSGKVELLGAVLANGANSHYDKKQITSFCQLKKSNKHFGPNLPIILSYNINQEKLQYNYAIPH